MINKLACSTVFFGAVTLLFAGSSRSKKEPAGRVDAQNPEPASATARAEPEADIDSGPPAKEIDPCSLITDEEIQGITGAQVQDRKPSQTMSGGLRVSQCYVTMPTAAESIAFAVFQRGDVTAPSPRTVWKQLFDRDFEKEKGGDEKGEEKEKARPEELEGLGEKAFVMPQRFGATVYALKGTNMLRLSVGGGPGDVREKKIETLKAIGEAVFRHL